MGQDLTYSSENLKDTNLGVIQTLLDPLKIPVLKNRHDSVFCYFFSATNWFRSLIAKNIEVYIKNTLRETNSKTGLSQMGEYPNPWAWVLHQELN